MPVSLKNNEVAKYMTTGHSWPLRFQISAFQAIRSDFADKKS